MRSTVSKQISIENQQFSRKVTWFGFILGRKDFPPKDLLSWNLELIDLLKCCNGLVRMLTRLICLHIIVFQQPSMFLTFLLTMKIKKTKWTWGQSFSSRRVWHRRVPRSCKPNLMSVQAQKLSLKTRITAYYFKTFFIN